MASSGKGAFINIFTSHGVYVIELVATTTVTLVGAIHVGTFLAAWVVLTLIDILTVPAIFSQFKACGAATLVGPRGVVTFMTTQTSRVMSALINIFTEPSDAVKVISSFTFAAVRSHCVDAIMTFTDPFWSFTLINIDTARAIFIEVVPPTTVHGVSLADVGTDRVYTDLPSVARTSLGDTFVDINTASECVLDKTVAARSLWDTTERPIGVLTHKLLTTVVDASLTLIYIFAVIAFSELVAGPTADLSNAAERALGVDATLSTPTVTGSQQALVDVLTATSIGFEFKAFHAGTCAIPKTDMITLSFAWIISHCYTTVYCGAVLVL